MSGSEISIDRERSFAFGDALGSAVCVDLNAAQTKMRLGHFRRDRQRLDRQRLRLRQASRPVVAHVRHGGRVSRESRADNRIHITWIERERALEKPPRLHKIARIESFIVPAHCLKIEVHRVRVGRAFGAPGLGFDELGVEGVGKVGVTI